MPSKPCAQDTCELNRIRSIERAKRLASLNSFLVEMMKGKDFVTVPVTEMYDHGYFVADMEYVCPEIGLTCFVTQEFGTEFPRLVINFTRINGFVRYIRNSCVILRIFVLFLQAFLRYTICIVTLSAQADHQVFSSILPIR